MLEHGSLISCTVRSGAVLRCWLLCSLAKENTMRSFRSILLALLLLAAGACGYDSPKKKAYRSLEEVIRLYQAGVDTIDAEMLAPALAYFPSKGDAATKGRLWYQWGLITIYQGELDKAIVSFEKALEQTRLSGDRHLEGLVCRAMADTYNRTFNIREDTVYLRKAWLAFDAPEDSLYRAETALRLVGAYMNAREWDQAGALLQGVLPVCTRNRILLGPAMNIYASFLLNSPNPDPEGSIRCFEAARDAGFPLYDDKLCDWGYAMYLAGRQDEAYHLWDSLEALHPEGLIQLMNRQYEIHCTEGRPKIALDLLEVSAFRQDSILRIQTSEAVSRAQRDYQEAVAEGERVTLARERDRKRAIWVVSILLVILLVVIGYSIWQEQRERLDTVRLALEESQRMMKRLEEAERRHVNKITVLERNVKNRESTLDDIRSDYLNMLRDGYRRLGQLFEDRQFAETQNQTEAVLYRRVCETLKDIDGDSKGYRRLQKYIEEHLGNPIATLQEDIPSLTERDIRLFCYLVIGYDAPLIAALMGVSKDSTIHSWKTRLVQKIRRLPAAKAGRYLDLIR